MHFCGIIRSSHKARCVIAEADEKKSRLHTKPPPKREQEERAPLWSVSKEWRTIFLTLLSVNVILATVFVTWFEISVRDADTPAETAISILRIISQVYVGIAIGTAVVVDVIVICKTVFTSAKGVTRLLSDLLKDALRNQEEQLAEEERRQEEVANLKQRVKELEDEIESRQNGS